MTSAKNEAGVYKGNDVNTSSLYDGQYDWLLEDGPTPSTGHYTMLTLILLAAVGYGAYRVGQNNPR